MDITNYDIDTEDEGTRKRRNRDSEVKKLLEKKTDEELRKWISIHVTAELARIQANRILTQQNSK